MASGENSPIYDDLMRFKPDGLTPNAWAVKAGVSRTVWADMRRHGNPSRRTLEKLLTAAGSSLAEFEALRIMDLRLPLRGRGHRLSDRSARRWDSAQLPALPADRHRDRRRVGRSGRPDRTDRVPRWRARRPPARPASLASDSERLCSH